MSRRSFDGTPPAGAGAFFDGPQLPPAFRDGDGTHPLQPLDALGHEPVRLF